MDKSLTEYMKVLIYARHNNVRVLKYRGLEVEFLPKTSPDLEGATLGDEAMQSLTEYMKVLTYARHNNVRVLKYHGLEVEFLPKLSTLPGIEGATLGDEAMPTEDQLLYWSSGHEEEIHATPPTE